MTNDPTNVVYDIRQKSQGSDHSLLWYKNQVRSLLVSKAKMRNDIRQESKLVSSMQLGKLYLFRYDPKLKATLPVYDTYPLVFPFNHAKGGFLGINLHYLPYGFRLYIIDKMEPYLVKSTYTNEIKRAKLSWSIMNQIAGVKSLDGSVKHYLLPHVQSSFMEIAYPDWKIAAALPVENFIKKP